MEEKKGKTVLIARGQKNPITVGIDYKIVCVNDFHAESGRGSLGHKEKSVDRVELLNCARESNEKDTMGGGKDK